MALSNVSSRLPILTFRFPDLLTVGGCGVATTGVVMGVACGVCGGAATGEVSGGGVTLEGDDGPATGEVPGPGVDGACASTLGCDGTPLGEFRAMTGAGWL